LLMWRMIIFENRVPIFEVLRSITGSLEFVREKWRPVFPKRQTKIKSLEQVRFIRNELAPSGGEEIIGVEIA
ncbi:hypothetical protein, partial [Mesorhizobium sp. M7A.F.Ca.US.006.01.2.1]|uniref:hypothetical protein n=1 Tax=Mesorhizobium sp. M7A.F.Ca.US.006.01.2.1 TaxID=2496708 RepID=UPI0019D10B4A